VSALASQILKLLSAPKDLLAKYADVSTIAQESLVNKADIRTIMPVIFLFVYFFSQGRWWAFNIAWVVSEESLIKVVDFYRSWLRCAPTNS